MEKLIIKEISKNCNWYERLVIKLFRKLFIKVYNQIRVNIINNGFK